MRNKYFLLVIAIFILTESSAQVRSYDFKKGEAFDILLFNQMPETGELFGKYAKEAISVAIEYGYVPQKGFSVIEEPIQGNYWPSSIIIGKWKDYEKRVEFTTDITNDLPDFHTMRRQIWSTFNLTYWEIKEDIEIEVNPKKYNVLTAHWIEDDTTTNFMSTWKNKTAEYGGLVLLELLDGTSPYGYHYAPNFLTIIEWDNKEEFEKFHKGFGSHQHPLIKHINQFKID